MWIDGQKINCASAATMPKPWNTLNHGDMVT